MACLYSVMLPWQQNTRQLKYQNTEVYLFILCYANFGDPGINGFGKTENATQVSKTVFSHLNLRHNSLKTEEDCCEWWTKMMANLNVFIKILFLTVMGTVKAEIQYTRTIQ